MVRPGGFEDKLHRARIFFGCFDQLTEACMVIAQLRWQSQRRGIEIEFVFRDIDQTVEKIFLQTKASNLIGWLWLEALPCLRARIRLRSTVRVQPEKTGAGRTKLPTD